MSDFGDGSELRGFAEKVRERRASSVPKRPYVFMLDDNKSFQGSTHIYLVADVEHDEFCLALAPEKDTEGHCIGYLKFRREGVEKLEIGISAGKFVLTEIVQGEQKPPCPVVSLSGVLWHRQEAVLVHRALSVFAQGLIPKN